MIRGTTLAELRANPALIAAAAAETGSHGPVNWKQLAALDTVDALLLLAVEVDGALVGYACAAIGPEFWGPEINCGTLSLFVQREHRGRWGLPLVRELASVSAARGAARLRVQVIPGSRLERLLCLHGFEARAVALEVGNMQYTAHHASGARSDGGGGPGLQRLLRRAPSVRREEGHAPAGEGAERS